MTNVKKNMIYQMAFRILTVLTPFITSPYLSRVLGAECLGVFSATYAYANYYILTATLGVEMYGSKMIALNDKSKHGLAKTFWNIYTVQFVACIISIAIYYLTFRLLFSAERVNVCMLQSIWILAAGLDVNWYFFGKQEFKITVIRNSIVKIITIISIFVFVKGPADLEKYVFIMSFGMLISQLVMWIFLIIDIGFLKPSLALSINHFKPMFILFIPIMAFSVFHIMDKTMVDLLSDEVNSGYYYNVDRLVNIPLGLVTALSTVMLPRISKMIVSETNEQLRSTLVKSAELTVFLACAVSFGLGAIAQEFVPFFFGEAFRPCTVLVYVFIPIIIIKACSDFTRKQFLIPTGSNRVYILAVCSGALVNLIANYLLIKQYDALGAVIGTFIAEAVLLFIEIIGCSNIGLGNIFRSHLVYVIIGLLMFVIVRLFSNILTLKSFGKIILLVFSGGLAYIIMCMLYWALNVKSAFNPYLEKTLHKMIKR